MTVSRLTARLDKLGGAKTSREVFLEIRPGESPEDLAPALKQFANGTAR
jgi:hypothetical protein